MSDILIRGMEMPKNCCECPVSCELWKHVNYDDEYQYLSTHRLSGCPLVPLPEGHGRLGDLYALQEEFKKYHGGNRLMLIDTAPTIVPAEGGGEDIPDEKEADT